MLLPLDCHPGLWLASQEAGGRAGDALRARARERVLNLAIVFLVRSAGHPVLGDIGRRTLGSVLVATRA